MPGALQASMAVAAAFPTKQVTQKAKKVYKLRAGHENEDFKAMMEQGSESFPKALTEMRTHVQDLVDANKYDEVTFANPFLTSFAIIFTLYIVI